MKMAEKDECSHNAGVEDDLEVLVVSLVEPVVRIHGLVLSINRPECIEADAKHWKARNQPSLVDQRATRLSYTDFWNRVARGSRSTQNAETATRNSPPAR